MKYKHAFHAGNFADFWKHLIWFWIIEYAQKKPASLDIIETHSGLGLYDLDELTYEFQEGAALFSECKFFAESEAATYWAFLHKSLQDEKFFPGSPCIAKFLKRSHDKLWLFEKSLEIYEALLKRMSCLDQIHIQNKNGFSGLSDLLHQPLKRLVILIDPAYERPEEYQEIAHLLVKIHTLKPQACVALWYPIGKRAVLMEDIFQKRQLWPDKTLNVQYRKRQSSDEGGLSAAGMLLINPPYVIADRIKKLHPSIAKHMQLDTQLF